MAWSHRKCATLQPASLSLTIRHKEVLQADGPLLLPPADSRSERVSRVTSRLVTALEEQDHYMVCNATWPPKSQELGRVIAEREAFEGRGEHARYKPSGTARSSFMPWRPASSNPLKRIESGDWNLYVVDLVSWSEYPSGPT